MAWAEKRCDYLLMWAHLFLHRYFTLMGERTVKKLNEFSLYIEIHGNVKRTKHAESTRAHCVNSSK